MPQGDSKGKAQTGVPKKGPTKSKLAKTLKTTKVGKLTKASKTPGIKEHQKVHNELFHCFLVSFMLI